MPISNPTAGAILTVVETEVYNAAAPTTWTDLDLSSIIGHQATLVILKFSETEAADAMAIRKKGDTDEVFTGVTCGGIAALSGGTAGNFLILLIVTDDNGVIEWRNEHNGVKTVDIVAYIK